MSKRANITLVIIAVMLLIFVAIPVLWALRLSLGNTFSASASIIPNEIQFQNYKTLFFSTKFPRWLLNSFIFAGSVTILNVIFAPPAGYVLARERLPGSNFILLGIVSAWIIPWLTVLIPFYVGMSKVGLVDTYAGLILPLAVTPISVFLSRQYISNIPEQLDEVARLDGCSRIGTFLRIILPLSKPVILIVALMSFMQAWGNYIIPLVMVLSDSMKVLTVGIPSLARRGAVNWGVRSAAAIFGILPMILLFTALNNYFMEGLALRTGTEQK